MTTRSVLTGNNFKIVVASIIVAIITLRDADCLVSPGIDGSYRWALNFLMAFNRGQLSGIIYPEGPLCLLKYPAPVGDHILICALFQMLLGAWFVILFSKLYLHFHKDSSLAAPILISTAFLMAVNIDYVFLGCVLSGMLLWKYARQKIPLYVGVLITVLAMYTKASFFVLCAAAWFMFAIAGVVRKEYKVVLTIILTGIGCYALIGLLIFGSIADLAHFAANNLILPFSYTDALSLYPVNNWKMLGLIFALLLGCFVLFWREPGGFLLKLCIMCFFVNWKYAIGREDFFHAFTFVYLIITVLVVFTAIQKEHLSRAVLLLVLAICTFNFSIRMLNPPTQYFWLPGFENFSDRVIHHKDFKETAARISDDACLRDILPSAMRRGLGNATVDIFPWDLSYVMTNDLNYKPRPYFQSPPLSAWYEQKDIAFLSSDKAPEYIIWHGNNFGQIDMDGLNNEYLPNEMPLLAEAILANYALAPYADTPIALYKKRSKPLRVQKTITGNVDASWGEWVTVPKADSGMLTEASVSVATSGLYGLRNFLYKGAPLYIEYETTEGRILHYRFSISTSKEGIFIDPLWHDPYLKQIRIGRIRFSNDQPGLFPGKVGIEWKRVKFAEQ
jgi:hypothetical protein